MGITPSEFRKNQKESDSADTGNLNSYPEKTVIIMHQKAIQKYYDLASTYDENRFSNFWPVYRCSGTEFSDILFHKRKRLNKNTGSWMRDRQIIRFCNLWCGL